MTPFGAIEATRHKGSLMGNRGDLHAPNGTLGKRWRSARWLSCILDGNGWKAPMDTPGRNYPLFFHDEAVALAAGHRPCGQCRPEALAAFVTAWKIGHGFCDEDWVPLQKIDRECHKARTSELRTRRRVKLADVPDGAFVFAPHLDHRPLLIYACYLWPWEHGGYGSPIKQGALKRGECVQLTPEPMVASIRAGYTPLTTPKLQPVATAIERARH